jgi:hypothetical protein
VHSGEIGTPVQIQIANQNSVEDHQFAPER